MSLGKRKRIDDDDEEPVISAFKRRKILKTYPWLFNTTETPLNNLFCVKQIPIPPKPPSFHLFRLPSEIRDKILRHAYGNQTVHVDITTRTKFGQVINPRLTYTIDWERFHPNREIPLQLPPLVSKRFYAEATAALYASSPFCFTEPHCFRTFALSKHACVSRLQRLMIPRLNSYSFILWRYVGWNTVLLHSVVDRLESLRGVKLEYEYKTSYGVVPRATDKECEEFWRYIHVFRQFELSPRHTEFKVDVYTEHKDSQVWKRNPLKPADASYEKMVELQRILTDGLLNYSPRRLSRRLADKRRAGFQVHSMSD